MSPEAKEEGSLTQTVIELVVKFVPTLINIISGETGPSQTDRIENIDLNVSYKLYKIPLDFTGLRRGLILDGVKIKAIPFLIL